MKEKTGKRLLVLRILTPKIRLKTVRPLPQLKGQISLERLESQMHQNCLRDKDGYKKAGGGS